MKILSYLRISLLEFSLAVFVTASLPAEVVIEDFNYWKPSSTYAAWGGEASPGLESGAESWKVTATNFGGAYRYLGGPGSAPNISGMQTLHLDVAVEAQSNGAGGIGFLVLLEDRDGTVLKYSRFGIREGERKIEWQLSQPRATTTPGTVEGFDFSDVKAFNLQIDAGGAKSYSVEFKALSASATKTAGMAPEATEITSSETKTEYVMKKAIPYRGEDPRYKHCLLDLYYPVNRSDFATVVFFHAGGLRTGNRYIPGELREQGIAVISADYSLYPQAKSPEFLEDAAATVAWAFENVEALGGSKDKIFVSGASAGGYLSMMIGLDKSWLAGHEIDANDLAGIVALSGQTITHVAIREEKGGHRAKPVVDALAPLNHVRGDAAPLLLVTGDRELELLGRYEENAYMKRMMEINGHKKTELLELKGKDHGGVEKPGHDLLLDFVKGHSN